MERDTHEIAHVSDTALMTAACRAMETVDPLGLIRDPFAESLAGERGMAIANNLPGLERMRFGVCLRSRFLDELLLDTITAHGIATVLSVGAGLDTRPWRLDLPAQLRWIEVDFPDMLDYKDAIMAAAAPRCRRERLSADVNEASGRESVFAVAAGDGPSLMITEGLLMYLPGATIEALAATASASHWVLDAASPEMSSKVRMDQYESIQNVRAADCLDGLQILNALDRHGWKGLRSFRYGRDVMQFAAERLMALFRGSPPDQMPKPLSPDNPSGVHLFGR